MENKGQNIEIWKQEWDRLSPETEIAMWDYFGLRQWVLKYTPRFGKVLEAGCGFGRYNFYLSHFGIDISGLDFSKDTISFLKNWQEKNGYHLNFIEGDITNLPFEDNSLSGYLSFGVVEHFIEGPQKPLNEANRVLRPGGIAIISTPSPSWSKRYFQLLGIIKKVVKKIINKKINKQAFFQYEYSSRTLKKHIEKQGFYISRVASADWLYTFTEFGKNTDKFIKTNSLGYRISHALENSWLSFLGAQSIVIAIKAGDLMHCFFCGENTAVKESLNKYDVPVCSDCESNLNVNFYKKGNKVSFHRKYIISPPVQQIEKKNCDLCNGIYETDKNFEKFGFDKNICPNCLSDKKKNIYLSNTSIQPIWRSRAAK